MAKPKIKSKRWLIEAIVLAGFFVCFFYQSVFQLAVFAQETSSSDEAADLAAQQKEEENQEKAEEKESKIDDLQGDLEKVQQEKAGNVQKKMIISNDINQINTNINYIEGEIAKSEKELRTIEGEISEKEQGIDKQKEFIADILRSLDQVDQEVGIMAINSNTGFEGYFSAIDSLEQLQGKLFEAMEEMKAQKAELDGKREEQSGVVVMQDDQKNTLQYEKNKKSLMLGQTQKKINQNDSEIGEIQSKISKLKADITRLLGKGYDAKDIEDAVRFAAKATGVRRDFLMGMLVVESDLGRFTGGCDFKESRMNGYRKDVFKKICEELDYNYKKQKVSCPPSGYSGTGGAMGVAQFMSDTWMGYQSRIAAATGHNPPDPWNLTDGVTAMALKLANDGATSKKGECTAAKRYLGGSHQWYCDKVLYWADNYEKLLGS